MHKVQKVIVFTICCITATLEYTGRSQIFFQDEVLAGGSFVRDYLEKGVGEELLYIEQKFVSGNGNLGEGKVAETKPFDWYEVEIDGGTIPLDLANVEGPTVGLILTYTNREQDKYSRHGEQFLVSAKVPPVGVLSEIGVKRFWRNGINRTFGTVKFDTSKKDHLAYLINDALEREWFTRYNRIPLIHCLALLNSYGAPVLIFLTMMFTLIVLGSTLLLLKLAVSLIMSFGAKKDKRFKTGYKGNVTPSDSADMASEMTGGLSPYISISLGYSFYGLLVLIVLLPLQYGYPVENVLGLLWTYFLTMFFGLMLLLVGVMNFIGLV